MNHSGYLSVAVFLSLRKKVGNYPAPYGPIYMDNRGGMCHSQAHFHPWVNCGFTWVGWHEAYSPNKKQQLSLYYTEGIET